MNWKEHYLRFFRSTDEFMARVGLGHYLEAVDELIELMDDYSATTTEAYHRGIGFIEAFCEESCVSDTQTYIDRYQSEWDTLVASGDLPEVVA